MVLNVYVCAHVCACCVCGWTLAVKREIWGVENILKAGRLLTASHIHQRLALKFRGRVEPEGQLTVQGTVQTHYFRMRNPHRHAFLISCSGPNCPKLKIARAGGITALGRFSSYFPGWHCLPTQQRSEGGRDRGIHIASP